MINLPEELKLLAIERPVFHSEADFQHSLAWQLHKSYPQAGIRLEYRPILHDPLYLDIWIRIGRTKVAIELKYFTRELKVEVGREYFHLKNQGAQDIRSFDFVKDLFRLERVIDSLPGTLGYAILLTNDKTYWQKPARSGFTADAFRLYEGRTLNGTLAWASHASAGSIKKRESPLSLRNVYGLRWNDYSQAGVSTYGKFQCLIVDTSTLISP